MIQTQNKKAFLFYCFKHRMLFNVLIFCTLAAGSSFYFVTTAICQESSPAIFVNVNDKTDQSPPASSHINIDQSDTSAEESKKESVAPAQSTPSDQTHKTKVDNVNTVLVLTKAVMCESIKGFEPAYPAVLFSVSLGKIFCFTEFENISQNAFVYHKWFHRDRFVATNRFLVKAPQWSTFSTMQLRYADKGPWRIEITDDQDKVLETLRFSIVD